MKHTFAILLVFFVIISMTTSAVSAWDQVATITKIPNPSTYTDEQNVAYTYTVTNTDLDPLSDISVADNLTGTITNLGTTYLTSGQQTTGTGNYTTTQSDYDNGSVTNTAMVYNGTINLNQTQATITAINQNPALTLTKIPNPSTYNDGQSVTYTYKVTNVGNVTLTSVNVADTTFGKAIILGTTTLAPGANTTGTYTYPTTQTDYDNGSVVDNALAMGTFKSTVVQAPASATVTAINQNPALTITKAASPSSYDHIGELITYTYTVKNTGNVDISAPITVTDDKAATVPIQNSGILSPGSSVTGSATYKITDSDINTDSVTNSAFATGSFNSKPVISPSANAIVSYEEVHNGDRDNYGGPGYGGYGGAVIPMIPGPMYGSPMYGSEPPMFGSEPSTTAAPSGPNVCKGNVSSSKCHKSKCALNKHKHKHHAKKHKAKKNC
jgi:hypothetical protein